MNLSSALAISNNILNNILKERRNNMKFLMLNQSRGGDKIMIYNCPDDYSVCPGKRCGCFGGCSRNFNNRIVKY